MKLKAKKLRKVQNNSNLLIIGLGNPGPDYQNTRHNAGFDTVAIIAEKLGISFKKPFLKPVMIGHGIHGNTDISLVMPLTYMNLSGQVLNYCMQKTKTTIDQVIIVCDNMDLKPGKIRLKKNGSSAGHNGLKSIIAHAGTGEFARMYIGVGRNSDNTIEHVLGRIEGQELDEYNNSLNRAAEALLNLSEKSFEQVMNEINQKNR